MEKRNRYTSEFKAKVVLELLREEGTLNQIAGKYELNRKCSTKGFMYLFVIIDLAACNIINVCLSNLDRQIKRYLRCLE